MIERFLHRVTVEQPPPDETATEARVRLADRFPRGALRRMTHLGMLVGAASDGLQLTVDDAIVYATTYGETRSLEDFLRSFPTPSPLLFQSSIHPSGVQQVMIGRQQPAGRMWPIASRTRLVEHALLTALLETAPRVALLGGEERGTWLLERGVASATSFAFAALLTQSAEGAEGRVAFVAGEDGEDPSPTLEQFTAALLSRTRLAWRGAGGRWEVDWR